MDACEGRLARILDAVAVDVVPENTGDRTGLCKSRKGAEQDRKKGEEYEWTNPRLVHQKISVSREWIALDHIGIVLDRSFV